MMLKEGNEVDKQLELFEERSQAAITAFYQGKLKDAQIAFKGILQDIDDLCQIKYLSRFSDVKYKDAKIKLWNKIGHCLYHAGDLNGHCDLDAAFFVYHVNLEELMGLEVFVNQHRKDARSLLVVN